MDITPSFNDCLLRHNVRKVEVHLDFHSSHQSRFRRNAAPVAFRLGNFGDQRRRTELQDTLYLHLVLPVQLLSALIA